MAETLTDWQSMMIDCMSVEGWAIEVNSAGGGIGPPFPGVRTEQLDQYNLAMNKCDESIGVQTFGTMSTGERRDMYDSVVAQADCIRQIGYSTPAAPSYQVFDEMDGAWSAFVGMDPSMARGLVDIENKCPLLAPWTE